MQMKERSYTSTAYTKYRFGMNTQEKDDDIFEGAYTAEFWEYDARLGRRWNLDVVDNLSESLYSTFHNNPVHFADPNGDEPDPKKQQKSIRKYGRKFRRMQRRTGWNNNQVHAAMERRHNNKKWMWVGSDKNQIDNDNGDGHSRYYHAGDLYREQNPGVPVPAAPVAPPAPLPLLALGNFAIPGPSVALFGPVFQIPGSGNVNLTFRLTGAATDVGSFTVSQGNTNPPTRADLTNVINPTVAFTPLASPQVVNFNVNIRGGNFIYVQTTIVGAGGSIGAVVGNFIPPPPPPPPPPPVFRAMYSDVIFSKSVPHPNRLVRSTRKDLNEQRASPVRGRNRK
jgi:hypothetical protein